MVRSLNARIPKSPIWSSSDAGVVLALSLEPESSVCGVRDDSAHTVRRGREGGDDLGLAASGRADQERPDRVAVRVVGDDAGQRGVDGAVIGEEQELVERSTDVRRGHLESGLEDVCRKCPTRA